MPTFGLADCNNFYVSAERVFRPTLEGVPVLVAGNNDGCVIARSNEVKALGIPMGAPLHTIRHLIKQHGIKVYSANFALYGDLSQRVMQVLESFASLEIYSIDEAFMDMAPIAPAQRATVAKHIRATVRKHTGIPVSIGIAPTKTLAKLANDKAKKLPDSVLELANENDNAALLREMDVEDVWGIGGKRAEWLRKHGVATAANLAHADLAWVRKHLHVPVARTVLELRGVSCLALDEVRTPKKEICTSRSFSHPVRDFSDVREAVATYATRAAEKLRKQHSMASILTVFIHTNPFDTGDLAPYAAHCAVPMVPTNETAAIIDVALRGLAACWRNGHFYHKVGVILSDFTPEGMVQGRLFDEPDPRRQQLQVVIDDINRKWGRDTIRYAATGIKRPWAMKQDMRTPRYTTRWDELPEVR